MKKQDDPLAPTKLNMRVMLNDLDLNMHVNNGRYLTFMDLGRIHLMSKAGLLKSTLKRKWIPVLGGAKVHFIRSLGAFNKFTMTTQVIYWDEKWIYLEQKIIRKNTLITTALLKVLFVHKKTKITPQQIMGLFPAPITRPLIPDHLKAWLDAEKIRTENS